MATAPTALQSLWDEVFKVSPPNCVELTGMEISIPAGIREACDRVSQSEKAFLYDDPRGCEHLLQLLAKWNSNKLKRPLQASKNLAVTIGATASIRYAVESALKPGERGVLFDPSYDAFRAAVHLSGGTCDFVPLHPCCFDPSVAAPAVRFDADLMDSKLSQPGTVLLILNNPMNIPGVVFTREELETIAESVIRHDIRVISDEVYFNLTYDGREHVFFAELPGMFERTISVFSAGKIFGVNGWRLGWSVGPEEWCTSLANIHSWNTYGASVMHQHTLADFLEEFLSDSRTEKEFYREQRAEQQMNRDTLVSILRELAWTSSCLKGHASS